MFQVLLLKLLTTFSTIQAKLRTNGDNNVRFDVDEQYSCNGYDEPNYFGGFTRTGRCKLELYHHQLNIILIVQFIMYSKICAKYTTISQRTAMSRANLQK